ncbi:hypothetical protein K0M31_006821, partial [Melipona bicolor]
MDDAGLVLCVTSGESSIPSLDCAVVLPEVAALRWLSVRDRILVADLVRWKRLLRDPLIAPVALFTNR